MSTPCGTPEKRDKILGSPASPHPLDPARAASRLLLLLLIFAF
jgi:hypothetical protein